MVPVKRRFESAAAIASLFLAAAHAIPAVVPAIRQLDVNVAMRDGVRLSANIFHPVASGRYPAILLRTPYDKGDAITPNFQSFVNHGYAVVVQDVRGRYDSGGVFEPINQEIQDGDDTLNWIARQPWSDGKVGMYRRIVSGHRAVESGAARTIRI